MHCAIYKSSRKEDTYLYIEREDDFSRVPDALIDLMGQPQLVMTLELTPERTLSQADPDDVRKQLVEEGYYLQLPPKAYTSE
jgi:uncharacterized protein YcgL (UPF0745 family)